MDITNDRHHDEITHHCASVCDQMLRLLDRVAGGEIPTPSELEQLTTEIEVLRAAVRPPQCAYDFVPCVPKCLN